MNNVMPTIDRPKLRLINPQAAWRLANETPCTDREWLFSFLRQSTASLKHTCAAHFRQRGCHANR